MSALPVTVPHRVPGPAHEATLLERENRFLARCRLATGEVVHAHVPDRGRLLEVLVPGAHVLLYRAHGAARRTEWSLLVCEDPKARVLVAIDPAGANARVRPLLERGLLPAIGTGWSVRPEVRLGESRVDFLLSRGDERLAVEVKSVGVVRDGVAMFPDAPTTRGVKHLDELASYVRRGEGRAAVLFVAQRGDARAIAPDRGIDPEFADALKRVRRTVGILGVGFDITADGCTWRGELPVLEG